MGHGQGGNIDKLPRITYPLRFNMTKASVGNLQILLAFLQYEINEREAEIHIFGKTTLEAVKAFQKAYGLPVTGEVDRRTAQAMNAIIAEYNPDILRERYRVRGTVRDESWTGAKGYIVEVYHKKLRREILLEERKTFKNGFFDVVYIPPQTENETIPSFQLVVKIKDQQGNLLHTEWVKHPKKVSWVNYTAGPATYKGRSVFAKYMKAVEVHLEDMKMEDIEESKENHDIRYLSTQTNISTEEMMKLAISYRLAKRMDLDPAVFYAFLHQNVPNRLPSDLIESTFQWEWIDQLVEQIQRDILYTEAEVKQNALQNALRENIVPHSLSFKLKEILQQLSKLQEQYTLESPTLHGHTSLKSLLDLSRLAEEDYLSFATLFHKHQADEQELWKRAGEILEDDVLQDVKLLLDVGSIAKNHLPTVKMLKSRYADSRSLAKLDVEEWTKLIIENRDKEGEGYPEGIDGESEQEKIEAYAHILKKRSEAMHPTVAFTSTVARGQSRLSSMKDIQKLVDTHPEFELQDANIDLFIKEKKVALHSEAVQELKMMQRVAKIAPSAESGNILLEHHLHSASQVYFQGKQRTLKKLTDLGIDHEEAKEIYEYSAQRYALLLAKLSEYRLEFQRHTPQSIGAGTVNESTQKQMKEYPSLEVLFGSMDFCACEHCRSVYSPASYLVDILRFLHEKDSISSGTSAKDILFNRRPDIGLIDLTCDNTNIPVPYIDLVNEILEQRVAPLPSFSPFKLDAALQDDLDKEERSSALAEAFDPPLSAYAEITVKEKGEHWKITEPAFDYTLKKQSGELQVTSRSLQTSGTAQVRRANPQYTHEAAYDELREQTYPWNLPFDLHLKEIQTYIEHLGVKRHQILEAFSTKPTQIDMLNDPAFAREYLQLSAKEWALMTDQANHQPWKMWGFDSEDVTWPDPVDPSQTIQGKWFEGLKRADLLILHSGLRNIHGDAVVDQLLNLLHTQFVNPGFLSGEHGFSIQSQDEQDLDSCSLHQMHIHVHRTNPEEAEALWVEALDRIHRFVRLANKLEWSYTELDQAIATLLPVRMTVTNPGILDESILIQLAQLQKILDEQTIPFNDLLGWWNDLDTARYQDPIHHAEKRPSFYDKLFLNRSVMQSYHEALVLNSDRTELKHAHQPSQPNPLSDHVDAIRAGLEIAESDFHLLMNALELPDELSLSHLSTLYRNVSIAKLLREPIAEYIKIRQLIEMDPFNSPASSLIFIDHVHSIRSFDFTASEVDGLLGANNSEQFERIVNENRFSHILEDLRQELQNIAEAYTVSSSLADSNGTLTSKTLAMIKKEPTVVERFISILNHTLTFDAELSNLPAEVDVSQLSTSLKDQLAYDQEQGKLMFFGVMSAEQKEELLSQSAVLAYHHAVQALYDTPRIYTQRHMRTFTLHELFVPLSALPSGVEIPADLGQKIYYDAAKQRLYCIGVMTEEELQALLALSDEADYVTAVHDLYQEVENMQVNTHDEFLSTSDVSALFDGDMPVEERFHYVLTKLFPHVQRNLSQKAIVQKLSDAFDVDPEVMNELLMKWVVSPVDPESDPELKRRSMEEFLAVEYTESHSRIELSPETARAQYKTLLLLYKVTLIIRNLKIEVDQIPWIYQGTDKVQLLDLNTLPVSLPDEPADPRASIEEWFNLIELCHLRDQLPGSENVLPFILNETLTDKAAFIERISEWTGWSQSDLNFFIGQAESETDKGYLDIDYPQDIHVKRFKQLQECMKIVERLGVSADQCVEWFSDHPTRTQAKNAIYAVKAKYEEEQWLKVSESLRDKLREQQRDALVSYLLTNPMRDEDDLPLWRDENDLYAYFLIDVEMSACQLTSRLKQAISSVQLFVQRCLMNLEIDVITKKEDGWDQWTWMKNYRIWEANRKVFLYPENLLEPELREDKTVFFEELENELKQNEMNGEHAERTFLRYLEKLDQVSLMEVCGLYHEQDEDTDIVHVIARTKATPSSYYYRTYVDQAYWTSWEKVDVDIEGDHLIPVVYHRKLYLLWPIFDVKTAKRQKMPPAEANPKPKRAPEPDKHIEIQLAWSIRQNGSWSAPKRSKRKLIHPWERPLFSYHFKPRVFKKNLWIDVYISTSKEFNGQEFYHSESANWERLTDVEHDEKYRPWHSSSFIFNGDVIDIKLKNLRESYKKVSENFGKEGRSIKKLAKSEISPQLILPPGMHFENTHLVNNTFDLNKNNLYVTTYDDDRKDNGHLLKSANAPFSLIFSGQDIQFDSRDRPFFYEDQQRSFFIKPLRQYWNGHYFTEKISFNTTDASFRIQYTFYPFYHPYTNLFIKELNRAGLKGLLQRSIQTEPAKLDSSPAFDFNQEYKPVEPNEPDENAQTEVVDFSFGGAYSQYNWELFFHAPFMIANQLSQNQKFEDAMNWFHYIFDPTSIEEEPVPQRYWLTKPFYENDKNDIGNQTINKLLQLVNQKDQAHLDQVNAWRKNPFRPHVIARYRPVAYQKAVVMKYLDNLIAWGDQLFSRDTIESINEATLLYVLAAEILGKKPDRLPELKRPDHMNYNEIEPYLDTFGNAVVEAENTLPTQDAFIRIEEDIEQLPRLDMFYFCIPNNENLLEYWSLVEDRLFKIRHCMNIEGMVRQLPLFQPPIDPAMLVHASAKGVDLDSVMSDLNATLPHYRYKTISQKAQAFCNEVISLGAKLLRALEKRDAEALSTIRSSHEWKLEQQMQEIKKDRIEELQETIEGLEKSKEKAEQQKEYYANLPYMNAWEIASFSLSGASTALDTAIATGYVLAGGLKLIPDFVIGASGFGGTPHATAKTGGDKMGDAAEAAVKTLSALSQSFDKMASLASTLGSYDRRKEEWKHLKEQAEVEVERIERDIEAAKIRLAMAEKELDMQEQKIAQAQSVDEFLRSKYTNAELYDWMIQQISSLYFQSYQLAYTLAKQAETCYRFELGIQTSSFIQFGHWDSLKKGLLAGEKLSYDLQRLESAYLNNHKRELEITKNISLAQVAPLSLISLKENGSCTLDIPEWIFDMDYPGHFMRRMKSVQISIPCVSGPYTSVNCTLTLMKSSIRTNSEQISGQYTRQGMEDSRFVDQYGSTQSIATSHAQNDSGLFHLNFNDERYLPFEGAGTISTWQIDLPKDCNPIDFSTVSDVILHIQYTAKDGGSVLRKGASTAVQEIIPDEGIQLLNMDSLFPNAWYRFLHSDHADEDQALTVKIDRKHFPFYVKQSHIKIQKIHYIFHATQDEEYVLHYSSPQGTEGEVTLSKDGQFGSTHHGEITFESNEAVDALGEWTIKIKYHGNTDYRSLTAEELENMFMIVSFQTA